MTRPVALKAIVGALLALSTWGGTALLDGYVDPVEWFGLLGALVTGGLVWLVKNGDSMDPTTSTPEPTPSEQFWHDRQAGSVTTDTLIGVAVVVGLVLLIAALS